MSQRKFLRFKDLKARAICNNHTTLARWIATRGFPVGQWLGANTPVWDSDEVEAWLAAAPVRRKAVGG
jgi:predicted DNA-binding transcriptional regulator AlpA